MSADTSIGSAIFEGGLINFMIRTAFIVIFAWVINKLIDRTVRQVKKKNNSNDMLTVYIRKILNAIIYAVAAFSVLSAIVPLEGLGSAVLGATSVITVVLGLAAQETFGNFIAGFFLALGQPFSVGDLITLPDKNITGTVQEITFRHTVLHTIENTQMIIPNSLMNSAVLENKVFGQGTFTRYMKISIAYDSDMILVKKLITETVMANPLVNDLRSKEEKMHGKEPFLIRLDDFQESGLLITFPVNTTDYKDNLQASSEIRQRLLIVFKENQIEIPYPKVQVLH
jgi:small-conductance mechanosensitive channel